MSTVTPITPWASSNLQTVRLEGKDKDDEEEEEEEEGRVKMLKRIPKGSTPVSAPTNTSALAANFATPVQTHVMSSLHTKFSMTDDVVRWTSLQTPPLPLQGAAPLHSSPR